MTFEEAHNEVIKEFDIATAAVRKCVLDPAHVNVESKEFKEAYGRLAAAIKESFRFKDVWQTVKRTASDNF